MEIKEISFDSIRGDWYLSNQTLPRIVRKTIEGNKKYIFVGFPRQWIPIFEWFGIVWKQSIKPQFYLPFFSDLSEQEIQRSINHSKKEGVLRSLVESSAILDPIISDFLYIVDNSVEKHSIHMRNELEFVSSTDTPRKTLILNNWQSYGRPSIRDFEDIVNQIECNFKIAVALPCSYSRPYNHSRTHKRIYSILEGEGYNLDELHRIVITSLGVVPQEVWELPQVLKYDAGVPDIYRILRLVRSFFGRMNYVCVLDCLQFHPYSDVLNIAYQEGLIKKIHKIRVPRKRHFVIHN